MKTRERIVNAALELFNEHGERTITTNHIAAHIDISPGNLYYHFRNKQEIVREIFESYSAESLERFTPVEAQEESLVMLKRYMDSVFTLMWKYRFFYANLPDILQRDPILHDKYLAMQEKTQSNIKAIFKVFTDRQLLAVNPEENQALVTSLHLVVTSWLSYQSAMTQKAQITEQVIHQGVLQLISIVKPHTTPLGLEQVQLIEEGIKAMHAD